MSRNRRGSSKPTGPPASRAQEVQRAFRERRRKHIADLEAAVSQLREENTYLRALLSAQHIFPSYGSGAHEASVQYPSGLSATRGSLALTSGQEPPFVSSGVSPTQQANPLPGTSRRASVFDQSPAYIEPGYHGSEMSVPASPSVDTSFPGEGQSVPLQASMRQGTYARHRSSLDQQSLPGGAVASLLSPPVPTASAPVPVPVSTQTSVVFPNALEHGQIDALRSPPVVLPDEHLQNQSSIQADSHGSLNFPSPSVPLLPSETVGSFTSSGPVRVRTSASLMLSTPDVAQSNRSEPPAANSCFPGQQAPGPNTLWPPR